MDERPGAWCGLERTITGVLPGSCRFCNLRGVPTRRAQFLLFLVCFLTFGWFHQGGGWNQNARFAEVRAIVEQGRFAIDDYLVYFPTGGGDVLDRARVADGEFMRGGKRHQLAWGGSPLTVAGRPVAEDATLVIVGEGTCTGDVGYGADGHFHPNKPPGTSLLAVPVYFIAWHAERLLGLNPDDWWVLTVNAWLCSMFTVGAASAIGVVLLWRAGLAMFCGSRGALPAALAFGFGTTFLPFGTLLFDHNLTAVLLLGSFMSVRNERPLLGGVLSGLAALTNYLAGFPGLIFGVWALLGGGRVRWKFAGCFVLGVLPCFAALLAYNAAALGSPFTLGTSFQNPAFRETAPAFLGMFTAPLWFAALTLTVSPWRGLFILSPVLILAVGALVRWPGRLRVERWIIVAVCAFYFLVNVCFNGFHGGFSAGPRYLIPALPFLSLALVPAFERWRKRAVILAAFSAFQQALLTVTDALNPLGIGEHAWRNHPREWVEKLTGNSLAWRYAWPLFFRGRAWPVIESEFAEWREKRAGTSGQPADGTQIDAWARVERGEKSPVPIAAMPGPVSVNVMGMWDGTYFATHAAHSPQCDWAAWNVGEFFFPRSRWSLAPLAGLWLAWALYVRRGRR